MDLSRFRRDSGSCPHCGRRGSLIADTASGEEYCSRCGYVAKEKTLETGPEWRAFTREETEDRARTGAPTSIAKHDFGLPTTIGKSNVDAHGIQIHGQMRNAIARMRIWDSRSPTNEKTDRNLRRAFGEMDRYSDRLGLPETVKEHASYIYRKALERGLIRGRPITHMAGASLYKACREKGIPRTLKDVAASVFGETFETTAKLKQKKDIARAYRILDRELGPVAVAPSAGNPEQKSVPVADPAIYVSMIASRVEISESSKRRALEILKRVKDAMESAGKDPVGLAASALYIACAVEGEGRTQKRMAEAAGVTEVTVRSRAKGMRHLITEWTSANESRDIATEAGAAAPPEPQQPNHEEEKQRELAMAAARQKAQVELIRIARDIGMEAEMESYALMLYGEAVDKKVALYPNREFAVACVVTASKMKGRWMSGADFRGREDVSTVVVNRYARKVEEALGLQLPDRSDSYFAPKRNPEIRGRGLVRSAL